MRMYIPGALLVLVAFATPTTAQELSEIRCGKVFQRAGATTPGFAVDKELRVMEQTAGGDFSAGSAPSGATLKSIFCFRSDIVPAPGDYKVVNAGYPLMIYARDNERLRIAVLETADGRLQYRGVGGTKFDPALRARIQQVLDDSVPKFMPRPVVR
jgi:hypothetical protein